MKVDSDPEDDSVLFSCVVANGSCMCHSGFAGLMHLVLCSRRMVLALVVDNGSGSFFLVLIVLLHLALCSRRFSACWLVGTLEWRSPPSRGMKKCAQSMLQLITSFTGNLDNILMSPSYLADIFRRRGVVSAQIF